MSLELLIYLFNVLDNLSNAIGVLFAIGLFALAMYTIFLCAEDAWGDRTHTSVYKKAVVALAIMVTILVLIPSKGTMYAMAAVSMGKEAIATDVGQKVLKAAEEWSLEALKKQ